MVGTDCALRGYLKFVERIRDIKGQNTVEYVMILTVIAGLMLLFGKIFMPRISGVFNQIMHMLSGAATTVRHGG